MLGRDLVADMLNSHVKDIKTLVNTLDSVLDNIFDMNGLVNKEANKLVEEMKKKYHLDDTKKGDQKIMYTSPETFTFKGMICEYPDCHFEISRYQGTNNIYIGIIDNEGPICRCTVNIPRSIPDDRIAIKDWSENEGMDVTLKEMNIIEGDPIDCELSGFVTIDIYMLGEKGKQLVSEHLKEKENG